MTATPRTALVTGAARGIGAAIATELASNGHRVAVADILDDVAAETATAIGGIAVHLDVTDTESVRAAVAAAEDRLGPLEILVNNAGWDEFKPFLQTDEELWQKIVEINYMGCLRCCRAVVSSSSFRLPHDRRPRTAGSVYRRGIYIHGLKSASTSGLRMPLC